MGNFGYRSLRHAQQRRVVELFLQPVPEERIIRCCCFEAIREANSSTQNHHTQESNDLGNHRQPAKYPARLSRAQFFYWPFSARQEHVLLPWEHDECFWANQSARARKPFCCTGQLLRPWC